jgi:hypothetical protein
VTKGRAILVLLVAVGFQAAAKSVGNIEFLATIWFITLTAVFAMLLSSKNAVRFIAAIVLVIQSSASVVSVVNATTDFRAYGLMLIGHIVAIVACIGIFKSASSWKPRREKSAPTNPWNAIDQGIDPTQTP